MTPSSQLAAYVFIAIATWTVTCMLLHAVRSNVWRNSKWRIR
jgi:hypothetical protein